MIAPLADVPSVQVINAKNAEKNSSAMARAAMLFVGLKRLFCGFVIQCAAIKPRVQAAKANTAPLSGVVGTQLLIQKKRTKNEGRIFKLFFPNKPRDQLAIG